MCSKIRYKINILNKFMDKLIGGQHSFSPLFIQHTEKNMYSIPGTVQLSRELKKRNKARFLLFCLEFI